MRSPGKEQTPGRTPASRKAEVGMVAERDGHHLVAGWPDGGRHRERSAVEVDRRLQPMGEGEGGQQLRPHVLESGTEARDAAAGRHGAHIPRLPRRHRPVDRQPVRVGVQVETVKVHADAAGAICPSAQPIRPRREERQAGCPDPPVRPDAAGQRQELLATEAQGCAQQVHLGDERGLKLPGRQGNGGDASPPVDADRGRHDASSVVARPASDPHVVALAPVAPSRWRRWSPTRSALAMAVRAGLTAPMLGKQLVSTT
jgi:hypothetical protein